MDNLTTRSSGSDSTSPWQNPTLSIGITIGVLAVLLAALQRFTAVQKDTCEPPFIYPNIPFIGHVLSLLHGGADYFLKLEKRHHQPIYTLPVMGGKLYMTVSPEWAQAIHRAHRSLQFNTLVAQALESLFALDAETMAIINENLNGEDGKRTGIMDVIHDMMFSVLAPGPFLDDLNKNILDEILVDINNLAKSAPEQIKLWTWIRQHFSVASTTAIWGPQSPFAKYPDVEPAFWEFESNAMALTMMPMPQIIARKGCKARERLFDTFTEYFKNGCYKDPAASQLIKNRAEILMEKFHLSVTMHARSDCSLLFGALLNTIPCAFWLISHIFEDNELLSEIRDEVEKCITSTPNGRTINVTKLRNSCPLFLSAFRETLRITGSVNINRYVAEDVVVTNSTTGESYLLKKGAVVQIGSNVIHQRSLWGSDADTFNPRRFMTSGEKARSEAGSGKPPDPAAPFRDAQGKVYSGAFRSFGGGNNICPGRHFAQTEILALASLFVAGFEIKGTGPTGAYKMPPFESFKLHLGVVKPAKDVEVLVERRKGYEDVDWAFEV